jgi:hypothetical protein
VIITAQARDLDHDQQRRGAIWRRFWGVPLDSEMPVRCSPVIGKSTDIPYFFQVSGQVFRCRNRPPMARDHPTVAIVNTTPWRDK